MTTVQEWHMPDPPDPEGPLNSMDLCECSHFRYAHEADCYWNGRTCNCKEFQRHPGYK